MWLIFVSFLSNSLVHRNCHNLQSKHNAAYAFCLITFEGLFSDRSKQVYYFINSTMIVVVIIYEQSRFIV